MSGRIRSIKPELLEDERVARLSDRAFRLFIGSLLVADDYGNLRWVTRLLQGQVFWGRNEVTVDDVEAAQIELVGEVPGKGLFHAYQVHDQWYAHVGGWERHQKVDHPGKPRVPRPEESKGFECFPRIRETLARASESLASFPESLAPDLRSPTSDLDLRGGENSRDPRETFREPETNGAAPDSPPAESGYDLAWRVWSELWQARHGETYQRSIDTGPKGDDRVLQRVGGLALTHGERAEAVLRSKLEAYLAKGTAWLESNRHPLRSFEADWNSLGDGAPVEPDDDDEGASDAALTAEQCAERRRLLDAKEAKRKAAREQRAKVAADLERNLASIGEKH